MSKVHTSFPYKTNRRLFGSVGSRINFIGHWINRSQFVWLLEFFACFNAEKCFSDCFFSPAWDMAEIVENDEGRRRYCFTGFQLLEHRFSSWKSLVTTTFEAVSRFLTKKGLENRLLGKQSLSSEPIVVQTLVSATTPPNLPLNCDSIDSTNLNLPLTLAYL